MIFRRAIFTQLFDLVKRRHTITIPNINGRCIPVSTGNTLVDVIVDVCGGFFREGCCLAEAEIVTGCFWSICPDVTVSP